MCRWSSRTHPRCRSCYRLCSCRSQTRPCCSLGNHRHHLGCFEITVIQQQSLIRAPMGRSSDDQWQEKLSVRLGWETGSKDVCLWIMGGRGLGYFGLRTLKSHLVGFRTWARPARCATAPPPRGYLGGEACMRFTVGHGLDSQTRHFQERKQHN